MSLHATIIITIYLLGVLTGLLFSLTVIGIVFIKQMSQCLTRIEENLTKE
jgi:hypothetical protein